MPPLTAETRRLNSLAFNTRRAYESLPEAVSRHLPCRLVDELEPIVQKHDIEGLMMGG